MIWVGWGCVWDGGYKYRWGIWETLLDVGLRYKDGELVLEIGGTIPFIKTGISGHQVKIFTSFSKFL